MKKDYPVEDLPKQKEPSHFSTNLPENDNNGAYDFKRIKALLYDK